MYRKYLLDEKIATEAELDEQEKSAEEVVLESVRFAESSPEPADEELFANIYADN
jgi:pyruvate dehydrogenase E1 component alpha subunit